MELSCSKKAISIIKRNNCKTRCDFCCLNYLHYVRTKNKLESLKKTCQNKDFSDVAMSSEVTKILEFNQYWKSDKITSIIYTDLKSLIKKVDGCNNNSTKLRTAKIGKRIAFGYSVSTIWEFDGTENKNDVCRGENCMKNFIIL